jgi:misacylated tRNA(Ala) deacylase
MGMKLFLEDSYARTAEATVQSVAPGGVMLDRTLFYARSGGQPGDTGRLTWPGGEALIGEAIKGEGEAILLPVTTEPPPPGTRLTAEIDWPRRYAHMRMHTALHLLCVLLPGAAVTGGQIGAEKSRLDFDLPERPEPATIEEGLARLIAADLPVTAEWVDESVLDTNPTLVRTLSVKPPRGTGRLRLVRIGDVDLQPCGGTHVARTGEIGRLTVAKIENKGRQNRRITLTMEP